MNRLALIILLLLSTTLSLVWPATSAMASSRYDDADYRDDGDEDDEDTPKSAADQRDEAFYDRGRYALDEGEWQAALEAFNKVVNSEGRLAAGALYWKAYTLNKLSRRTEALSALDKLREEHSDSRWYRDARALELEIRQASGKPVPPEDEDTEDLKLVALNALLNMDPDRAVPMLEKFIQSGNTPQMKERALFVLVQTGSPRARDLVASIARGRSNPELQRKSIEYLGIFGDDESHRLLKEVYNSTADQEVKESILQAWMTSGDTESLLAAARSGKDASLRGSAINLLGAQGATDELWQMYGGESSAEIKERILSALAVSGDSDRLLEVARTEKDARLRRAAIQSLGITGQDSAESLVQMYWSERDLSMRRAVLDALFVQGDATPIIAIARKETNPEMRKEAVSRLSTMGDKEATDYLLELLKD